jgi:hypothetical protein
LFRKLAEVATARETAVAGSSVAAAHETAVAAEAEADEAAASVVDEAAAPVAAADEEEAEADEAAAAMPDEAAVAPEGYFAVKNLLQATSIISLNSNLKAVLVPRYY